MASYGFELEFSNYSFQENNTDSVNNKIINPKSNIFELKTGNNGNNDILYFIRADLGNEDTGQAMEIISNHLYIGNQKPTMRKIFDPIDLFFNFISEKLADKTGDLFFNEQKDWTLNIDNQVYLLSFVYNTPIKLTCIAVQKIVNPQFTFGFYTESVLENFYKYMQPLEYFKEIKNMFLIQPYCEGSKTNYKFYFNSTTTGDRWRLLEFLRFYIACSLQNNINPYAFGNKSYMHIMSRVSIRNNMIKNYFTECSKDFHNLCAYITEQFKELTRQKITFPLLHANSLNSDDPDNMDCKLNDTINNTYRTYAGSLLLLIKSIFTKESFDKQLTEKNIESTMLYCKKENDLGLMIDEDEDEDEEALKEVKLSLSNISNYDFLSPVPYSCNDNPMGLYSRVGTENTPKYLFEIRYVPKLLEKRNNINNNEFGEDFKKACIDQFKFAYNNWDPWIQMV